MMLLVAIMLELDKSEMHRVFIGHGKGFNERWFRSVSLILLG